MQYDLNCVESTVKLQPTNQPNSGQKLLLLCIKTDRCT